MLIVVAVAVGFDPLHGSHLAHLKHAKALGDILVVLLNPDADMVRKKGYTFLPFSDRREILQALRCVDQVEEITDGDGTCAQTLARVIPAIFAKGGDRGPTNMPKSELDICERLCIKVVYNVGGGKVQSSSELVRAARERERARAGQ